MLYLINDTKISITGHEAIPVSSGGTASYIAGFISFLMNVGQNFNLIGNFKGFADTSIKCYPIYSLSSFKFLLELLIKNFSKSPDSTLNLYYCHRPDHLAITLLRKGKHVVHLHGQPHTTINNGRSFIRKFIYNRLEAVAIKHADLIIATDKVTAGLYSSLYPSSTSSIKIIPTGVDLTVFNNHSSFEPFQGIIENTFNLAYIGRLAYPKQVGAIIESFVLAFAGNPAVHLWIAGSGPDEAKLRETAGNSACSANIHFTGKLTRNEVVSLIHSSSAGILLSHNEGSPISVKEFLACGKPVIVNDVGDLRDYVFHGENGYIVHSQDIQSVAQAMKDMLLNAHLMKESARESMMPYDDQLVYQQVLDTLLKVQSGK